MCIQYWTHYQLYLVWASLMSFKNPQLTRSLTTYKLIIELSLICRSIQFITISIVLQLFEIIVLRNLLSTCTKISCIMLLRICKTVGLYSCMIPTLAKITSCNLVCLQSYIFSFNLFTYSIDVRRERAKWFPLVFLDGVGRIEVGDLIVRVNSNQNVGSVRLQEEMNK